ncbi:MAG: 2Fe-2S iron-sulfur cluster-binding protein [Desulfotomaculales bacterium]
MGRTVSLTIDDRTVTATEGERLLWVALDNGIYIPHLCAIREADPAASCRLCFVEVEGYPRPVTACTEPVRDGMVVRTRSPQIDRLVATGFELLMSVHRLDCAHCPKNRRCELQQIAVRRKLKLRPRRLAVIDRNLPVDDSHPLFSYDPNKCVLCGRCVWTCRQLAGAGVLGFAWRGFERRVTTFEGRPLGEWDCSACGLCVEACPVGALVTKEAER